MSRDSWLTNFTSVIIPTVESLLKAIKYYEVQGGTASIYVNDDGMQVVDPELAEYVLSILLSRTLSIDNHQGTQNVLRAQQHRILRPSQTFVLEKKMVPEE
jgi:hypothetical protein